MQVGRQKVKPLSRAVLFGRLAQLHTSRIEGGQVTTRVTSPIIASGVRPILMKEKR
jgi:hypothetical protein